MLKAECCTQSLKTTNMMNSDPASLNKDSIGCGSACGKQRGKKTVQYNGNIEHVTKPSRKAGGGWEDLGGALWQL